jgi:hypothetical protein
VPQTREYIEGALGYVDLFRTWPGDWNVTVTPLVCEGSKAVCFIDFMDGTHVMTGIPVFELTAATIVRVTDYWPAPYEPPARASGYMKRATVGA